MPEIIRAKCRYCGVNGNVRHMVISFPDGRSRKTGPFCVDEQACWERRHKDVRKNLPKLEALYG